MKEIIFPFSLAVFPADKQSIEILRRDLSDAVPLESQPSNVVELIKLFIDIYGDDEFLDSYCYPVMPAGKIQIKKR